MFVKKSIFFYIPIVFVSIFTILNLLFFTIYKIEKDKNQKELEIRSNKALKLYQNYSFYNIDYKQFITELKLLNFEYIKEFDLKKFKNNRYKNYIYIQNSFTPLILKDTKKYNYNIWLYLVVDTILISVFIFLIKKLLPLRKIVKMIKNPDEISQIPNTFYEIEEIIKAINDRNQKIKSLNESRKLFLRNIFHELLTPITKIKLTSNLIKDKKQRIRIDNSINRLEYVINELKTIETLISGNIILNLKNYSILDIIDNSLDISLHKIDVKIIEEFSLRVDIEYFSIALKNLIDNSYKYGIEAKIIVLKNKIIIENKAPKLPKKFNEYLKPFNHSYENSTKGMGLGLYISNEIIKLHSFKLKYCYKNGKNLFIVEILDNLNSQKGV